jgi:hypothetical protein
MVMLPGSVVRVPALSLTATVKVNVPAVVGVPDSLVPDRCAPSVL